MKNYILLALVCICFVSCSKPESHDYTYDYLLSLMQENLDQYEQWSSHYVYHKTNAIIPVLYKILQSPQNTDDLTYKIAYALNAEVNLEAYKAMSNYYTIFDVTGEPIFLAYACAAAAHVPDKTVNMYAEIYNKLLKYEHLHPVYSMYLANFDYQHNNVHAAIKRNKIVLDNHPNFHEARFALIMFGYLPQEEYNEALDEIQILIENNWDLGRSAPIAAFLYMKARGDTQRAVEHFEKALAVNEDYTRSYILWYLHALEQEGLMDTYYRVLRKREEALAQ